MSALPPEGINGAALGAFGPEQLAALAPLYGDFQAQLAAGARPGVGASMGGSRGSKAPKKKEDDDAVYTTVMLRNIPNKYTQQMLLDQLHRTVFRGEIDYLYLPIDFANRCNCGYCFVNFRSVGARQRFGAVFDNVAVQSCLPGFNSYKVCQVTRAKWQGRDENVRRLRSGPELMAQLAAHPEWLPLLLDENGNQETFPIDNHAQAPAAPLRRRGTKGGGGPVGPGVPGAPGPGLQVWPGLLDPLADGAFLAAAGGRGKGGGVPGFAGPAPGGKGRGRSRGGRGYPGRGGIQPNMFGGMPAYPGLASLPAYAGMPGVPVMTEQGLQYLPYYGGYGAGGLPGGFMPPPYTPSAYTNNWYNDEGGYGYGGGGGGGGEDWQHQQGGDDAGGTPHQQAMAGASPRRVDLAGGDDDHQASR